MTADTRPDALAALRDALGETLGPYLALLGSPAEQQETIIAGAASRLAGFHRLTPAPAAESGEPETRYPCLIQIAGGLAPGCLIAGTDYRVVEVRSHWPKGAAGDPDNVTVIRFDPVARAQGTDAAGLDVEEAARRLDNTDVVAADALRAEHPERFR